MMILSLIGAVLLATMPWPAAATCPTPWTGATYDATSNRVRICSSRTDIDMKALGPTDLTSCTITASTTNGGVEVKVVTPVVPDTLYEVTFSAATRGLGLIAAFCTGADGQTGELLGPQSAQFRRAQPARPGWLAYTGPVP